MANIKKLKDFFHSKYYIIVAYLICKFKFGKELQKNLSVKTDEEALVLIDKDESGGISKAEIDSLGNMLGLQHVYPKETRDVLWYAIADEDGEIHVEDQERLAEDRWWKFTCKNWSCTWKWIPWW